MAVICASVIIQRANWRSALSAASTLRGARNVPSCRKYRLIVITACGAAAWNCGGCLHEGAGRLLTDAPTDPSHHGVREPVWVWPPRPLAIPTVMRGGVSSGINTAATS
jgi:hypothetical protein